MCEVAEARGNRHRRSVSLCWLWKHILSSSAGKAAQDLASLGHREGDSSAVRPPEGQTHAPVTWKDSGAQAEVNNPLSSYGRCPPYRVEFPEVG